MFSCTCEQLNSIVITQRACQCRYLPRRPTCSASSRLATAAVNLHPRQLSHHQSYRSYPIPSLNLPLSRRTTREWRCSLTTISLVTPTVALPPFLLKRHQLALKLNVDQLVAIRVQSQNSLGRTCDRTKKVTTMNSNVFSHTASQIKKQRRSRSFSQEKTSYSSRTKHSVSCSVWHRHQINIVSLLKRDNKKMHPSGEIGAFSNGQSLVAAG